MEVRTEYTYGSGFNSDIKVNPEQSLNDLLMEASRQINLFDGFALNVKYNAEGVPSALYSLPFESTRLTEPDENGYIRRIAYNPYFNLADFDDSDTVYYPTFAPEKAKTELEEAAKNDLPYYGQVLWVSIETEYNRYYPNPTWFGGNVDAGGTRSAMLVEATLYKLLQSEVDGGFLQNTILKLVGDPSQPIPEHADRANEGKSYTTVGEEFQEMMKSYQGIDAVKMLVLWASDGQSFPELEAFPKEFNFEKLIGVRDDAKRTIATSFGVPTLLANIESTGSISKDDISSAVLLMQTNVRMRQSLLQRSFLKVLTAMNFKQDLSNLTIGNYTPLRPDMPEFVWEYLSDEQKAEWIANNIQL